MDTIRGLTAADDEWVLALNKKHERETSPLDAPTLAQMRENAFRATASGARDAFLLAFNESAAYRSPNFLWFKERYQSFLYVDRIIVDPAARKRRIAAALYEDLYAAARLAWQIRVVCEVNEDPPNPASDAFHAREKFAEVGRARLQNGKSVRYLLRKLR